ncbi:hypothetical protein [Streptomyces sp. NPDC048436]
MLATPWGAHDGEVEQSDPREDFVVISSLEHGSVIVAFAGIPFGPRVG